MAFPVPASLNPTTLPLPDPEAYTGEPREYARALMQRKDEIEAEMEALRDVLASHGTNATTPLVDPEGYPRGDLDIYAIRHARASLARLVTDRSEVNARLATALEAAFSPDYSFAFTSAPPAATNGHKQPNGHDPSLAGLPSNAAVRREPDWPSAPVAKVNSVAPSSPAAASGLQAGDVIYDFAGVTVESGGLQAIGSLVGRSEGVALAIRVLRGAERVTLTLTPRTGWGGRGSLGCHILPP